MSVRLRERESNRRTQNFCSGDLTSRICCPNGLAARGVQDQILIILHHEFGNLLLVGIGSPDRPIFYIVQNEIAVFLQEDTKAVICPRCPSRMRHMIHNEIAIRLHFQTILAILRHDILAAFEAFSGT